jgi:hypothetical protein
MTVSPYLLVIALRWDGSEVRWDQFDLNINAHPDIDPHDHAQVLDYVNDQTKTYYYSKVVIICCIGSESKTVFTDNLIR